MQSAEILQKFRLVFAAAIQLKELFDKNEPPAILRANLQQLRIHIDNLKRYIPAEIIEKSDLNRHLHFVDFYLLDDKPAECYKDISDICYNDIFNIQQEYFTVIEATDNDTVQIKAIKKQLLILKQPNFTSSSWITSTERILRRIFPNDNIKLLKFRNLPQYMELSGVEAESYENLLNGFIDELQLDMPDELVEKWSTIHPEIARVSKFLFDDSHFGNAVYAAFVEINDIIKESFKKKSGKEKDGDSLMREVFSPDNPIYVFDKEVSEKSKNIQRGYMDIFAGAIKGVRNPSAHKNIEIHHEEAWELIVFASHLMRMWDKCKENE